MATIIEKTGKTVEDALSAALAELGVTAEDVEYTILEEPSKRLFGLLGATPAKIQVQLKEKSAPAVEEKSEPITNFEATIEEKVEPIKEPEPVEESEPAELAEEIETASTFNKDEVIDAAKKFLSEVFAAMKIDVKINVIENDSGIVLDLSGKNLGVLIGKHGQTLDALQYLANLAANKRDSVEKVYFTLDIENYRDRRAETLKKLAKSTAERAIRTKQDVRLEPMSRGERKIIHTVLQDNEKVETHSAGEEPYRYVIVSPKKREH